MRNSLIPYLDKIEGLNLVIYLKRSVSEKNDNDFEKEISYLIKKFKK